MGRARIVKNIGGGLYQATPLVDFTALDAELAKIDQEDAEYAQLLMQCYQTIFLLREDEAIAESAYQNVIQQWQDKLLQKLEDLAPIIPPPTKNDPATGQPWEDPDRAQDPLLFTAINQARSANSKSPASRNNQLDRAALVHLRDQGYTGRMGHLGATGSKPEDRVRIVDYRALTVGETLDYGSASPEAAVQNWLKNPEAKATLLTEFQDVGVAYKYSARHSAGYLWAAVYANPDPNPPGTVIPPPEKKDPPQEQAETTEAELDKVKPPRTDPLTPDNLGKVVAAYAKAIQKRIAAEKELEKLMAAKLARASRKAELTQAKQALNDRALDVWACYFDDTLAINDVVYTAEIPGFWRDEAIGRYQTIYAGMTSQRDVFFEERSWNIVKRVNALDSTLRPAVSLSPERVFVNLALEPGHLKWRPAWRYGTITAINGNHCDVRLNAEKGRKERREAELDLSWEENLTDVPIEYACIEVFYVGAEVLLRFHDQDRTKPIVIGFRRGPQQCRRRISWEQIM